MNDPSETDEYIIKDWENRIAEGRELEGLQPGRLRPSRNLSVSFAIRLSPQELEEFSKGAKAKGMSLAELMRSATRAALAGELDADKAAAATAVKEKARELVEAANRL
jgi:hypothetical protein